MEIYKKPLHQGQSYPLKASALEAAIVSNAVQTTVSLYQRSETWWTDGVLFRADFYPPGQFHLNDEEVLHVTCRSVPSSDRQEAQAFIEGVAIPEFVRWIKDLEALPSNSTVRRETIFHTGMARIERQTSAMGGKLPFDAAVAWAAFNADGLSVLPFGQP